MLCYVKKRYSLYDMHFILVKLYNIKKNKQTAIADFEKIFQTWETCTKLVTMFNFYDLTFWSFKRAVQG